MRIASPVARTGEEIAVNYLKKLGYKIIDRNFRARNTEIDIVAVHKNVLVFIEVKTRTSNLFGTPLEQIAYWKIKSLVKAAEHYKISHSKLPEAMRIDAISVQLSSKEPQIEHIQNISGF
jgi:putative endonuclease